MMACERGFKAFRMLVCMHHLYACVQVQQLKFLSGLGFMRETHRSAEGTWLAVLSKHCERA